MEQTSEPIKKTLIGQYARLSYQKADQLTVKMQQTEWWEKEEFRLNVQQKVSLVGMTVGIISFLLIILFSYSRGFVPMQSFIGCTLSLFILQRVYSHVEERARTYQLLSLTFNRSF
jgi:hypothetical protein